jgi:choice-of-anchor B domain-containing protein
MYFYTMKLNWLVSCIIGCLLIIHVQAQDAQNMTLLAHWSQDSLLTNSSNVRYNDCFGFIYNGNEYAIAGSTEGTHVFFISPSNQFVPVGFVKGRFSSAQVSHRDYATFQHYLYAVCDEGVSSLQIIDLQYLPDSIHLAHEDSVQFGRVHNIVIDTNQAVLYSLIHRSTTNTQSIEAPMKLFSLANPLQPVEKYAGPSDVLEVHDAFVKNGKAILNCGFDGIRVYNFNDLNNPIYLSSKTVYQDQGYNHQGWLTPNGHTYLFADETNGKRVKKCSFDGINITIESFFGTNYTNQSVPHNIMATDTFAFVAYYNEGIRVFDLRYGIPLEIAHYDTYPDQSFYQQNGNWGIYSNLPSRRILASDRQYGLFLFDFDQQVMSQGKVEKTAIVFPNPTDNVGIVTVRLPIGASRINYILNDTRGRSIQFGSIANMDYFQFDPSSCTAGSYLLSLQFTDKSGMEHVETHPLVIF